MRLNINLATQKYEDAGAFYVRWGTFVGAALLLTLILGWVSWSSHSRSVQARKRISELQQKIAELDRQKDTAESVLNRQDNHDVRAQSRFWNDRISQRSFSWTLLFSELEKIMPKRASLVAVQPETESEQKAPKTGLDQRLKLKLSINGEKYDDAIELVKNMESSRRFHVIGIETEIFKAATKGSPATVQFRIETYYMPPLSQQFEPAQKEGL
ncbi:MAG TPA: hypothetical protein VFK06_22765 [Candidatus Angelobacter sp.]|nr:hypothetical protein [Candidatus Angelobacter sp.]